MVGRPVVMGTEIVASEQQNAFCVGASGGPTYHGSAFDSLRFRSHRHWLAAMEFEPQSRHADELGGRKRLSRDRS